MAKDKYKTTEAHRARSKQYYESHKEQCAKRKRDYYLKHPEKIKPRTGAAAEAHRVRSKRWYEANKKRVAPRQREYYLKNKKKIDEYHNEWARKKRELRALQSPPKPRPSRAHLTPEEALERRRESTRKWRTAHPDDAGQRSREWRQKNRGKILAEREVAAAKSRAYRAANLDKVIERERQWKKDNLDKIREYNRNRKARLSSRNGKHTAKDIEILYHLQEAQCVGCNALLYKSGPERFHVDHIVPLFPKDGGPVGSNSRDNLQLLCPRCNLSKSNLSQEQWDRREGRLL